MSRFQKVNKTGRSATGPAFVQLFRYMLDAPAWRSLTPAERAVYVEIAKRFNGYNNGRIGFSARCAADSCNISKTTAIKCFHVLQERGFVDCVTPGGFSRKTRHAAEWRLNTHRCDVSGAIPSRAFKKWAPPENAKPGTKSGSLLYQNEDTQEAICA